MALIFHSDDRLLKTKNYIKFSKILKNKITKALTGWQTRGLALLGRNVIFKTFGLLQVV